MSEKCERHIIPVSFCCNSLQILPWLVAYVPVVLMMTLGKNERLYNVTLH